MPEDVSLPMMMSGPAGPGTTHHDIIGVTAAAAAACCVCPALIFSVAGALHR